MNLVTNQFIDFIEFLFIGILISCIFDFFRTYRKIKKVSDRVVVLQDIIYFFIVTVILSFSIVNILDSKFRLYILFAVIIGSFLYFSLLSSFVIKIYTYFLKIIINIFDIIILPVKLILELIIKIINKIKKIIKICCKKFFYVISLLHNKFSIIFLKKINLKNKRFDDE